MSNPPPTTAAHAVRLEDVMALHREIAALVRVGMPLELGLRGFAGGLPTRLGRLADRIADRLSEGKSLAEAIEFEGAKESAIYSAVISAGVRSGKLAEALESLAASCEQLEDTRRHVSLALIYPIVVCVVAYLLLMFFLQALVPRYLGPAEDFGFGNDVAFQWLRWLHARATIWAWLLPLLFGLVLLTVRYLRRRQGGGIWTNSMHRWLNHAQFADILKIQIEHGLPMAESFVRAANSTTEPGIQTAARLVSQDLNRGIPFTEAISKAWTLPPMMRWTLASGERQRTLVKSLKLMCDSYRRRALRQARLLQVWFPVAMTVFVSGTIVFLYGLLFFGVLASIWQGLLRE